MQLSMRHVFNDTARLKYYRLKILLLLYFNWKIRKKTTISPRTLSRNDAVNYDNQRAYINTALNCIINDEK